MRKSIKIVSLLVALFMVSGLVLTGCGSASKAEETTAASSESNSVKSSEPAKEVKEVTIRYGLWGSEEEQNIQKEAAKGIETVYPGVKLEVTPYPDSTTFWQQLPAQVAAKTAPDIIQLTNEGHIEYITKGSFLPIDEEIKQAGVDLSKYADTAKNIWTYDGKLYGIPMGAAPAMFFINKDMWDAAGLKEYPKTWDEVKTAAKALTTKDVAGIICNIDAFHLTNYVLSFGGGWGNGKTINSPENVKGLEFFVSLFDEKIATSPKHAGLGWDGEVFANKKGAMTTGGNWYKGFLKNSGPDIKYVALPIPKGTVEACTMHSGGIVVLKDTQDKLAAVKAAAYMAREECLQKMMEGTGLNPALTSLTAKYYEVNPEFKAIEPSVKVAKDFGYPAEGKKFIDALVGAMESKILAGDKKSVKEILDGIQKDFN